VVTLPPRAIAALDAAVHAVEDRCGMASNLGKTRVIAIEAGPAPPGIAELGDDACEATSPAFVQAWGRRCRTCSEEQATQTPTPALGDPIRSRHNFGFHCWCFAVLRSEKAPGIPELGRSSRGRRFVVTLSSETGRELKLRKSRQWKAQPSRRTR